MMSKPEFTLRTGIYPAIEPELFKRSLTGKVALVTGSGRGIGREIAFALARSGAAVAVSGRTESEVQQTTKDVLSLGAGVKAIGVVADACIRTDLERLVKEVSYFHTKLQTLADLSRYLKALVQLISSSAMPERILSCHST
jgi:NAD(P)-dependent dehydrogenase (short-subunit alcohol dehydrogenase family)